MNRSFQLGFFLVVAVALCGRAALAADPPEGGAGPSHAPAKYDVFVKGATASNGLIGVIRKEGKVYLAVPVAQLGKDYIEISVPATGLGGFGPAPGEPYVAPARTLRFDRVDDTIVIRWPNTFPMVDPNTPQSVGAQVSFPNSVVAVVPIEAESDSAVVISAAPFLGDVADLRSQFEAVEPNPQHAYRLDPSRTFFTEAKAFPQNTIVRVSQTWASESPNTIDNVPDPRSIEVRMTYNIVAAPSDHYMPRIADPRVGFFEQPLIDFSTDRKPTRNVYYLSRWNFDPERPGQPSPARHPIIFTLSNDIPLEYREPVSAALLAWNDAFNRIGIQNAISVQQQPSDPTFDVDDVRNNMVSWFQTSTPQYGAEALIINDPRTGEQINVGINVDAVVGLIGSVYHYVVAPARGLPDNDAAEKRFVRDAIVSTVLHEAGHDMGLQHNFIGSMAYTAHQLQDPGFTARMGVASSVMEYAPVNLWPRGTSQGSYFQTVLGPYDYYAMQYGYGYIPNATTPQAELPALNRIASRWSDPVYRFASDEDVAFGRGHAIDPRVQQDDLSDHPLAWERTELTMFHGLMNAVDARYPKTGQPYDEARRAFTAPLRLYLRDVLMPAHIIGGEYLSRANAGDPHSTAPLRPVSRSDEYAAWKTLEDYLFSETAWHFNPNVLNRLTYSEVSSLGPSGDWVYNPSPRHDVAIVQIAQATQEAALDELFAPLTLQRIDELSTKYAAGATMTLTDLFDWSRDGIFGDLANGKVAKAGVVRRNLQVRFAKRLAQTWIAPAAGTPADAQSLARLQLVNLVRGTTTALRANLGELPRAHVEALRALAQQALDARATIAAPAMHESP